MQDAFYAKDKRESDEIKRGFVLSRQARRLFQGSETLDAISRPPAESPLGGRLA